MRPDELARSGSEHGEQAAFFAFCNKAALVGINTAYKWSENHDITSEIESPDWRFKWVFAIPNGGSRGGDPKSRAIQGARMKSEGVVSGVADIFVPVSVRGCHGLFIEMKKPDLYRPKKIDNGCSEEQKAFLHDMSERDYGTVVCYTWREARDMICRYMGAIWL